MTTRAEHTRLPALLLLAAGLLLPPEGGFAQIRPVELEGLVITGTPVPRLIGAVGSHVTVLEGARLRKTGLTQVTDALRDVPGLVVVQGGSYGAATAVFFRGAESDHVKVLVDGVEVNQAGGSFDFAGILLDDVERIEVVRGPASALYGSDAMAGVIQVVTRRGEGAPRASLLFRGGSYRHREWSVGLQGSTASAGYALSLSQLATNGILPFNNRHRSTILSGSAHLEPDDRTRVSLTGRYGDRVYHFPTDDMGNPVDRNAFSFGTEAALGVDAGRVVADRVELRAAARVYDWDGGTDDAPDGAADTLGFFGYSSLDAFRRTALEVRGNVALWGGSVLALGAEWEGEQQRSFSESLSQYGPYTGRSRNQRQNLGYFAHVLGQGRGWAGNAGVRLEDNQQYGAFLTYQAGASYALSPSGTRVRGSLGRGLKEPTFLEAYSTGFTKGNPELDPERSQVWEVGVEQAVGEVGGLLSLTWFHQSLEDLIQYTFTPAVPGGPNFYNVARARARGVEAGVDLPLGPVGIKGGYTFLDTEVVDAGFQGSEADVFAAGEPLLRRPRHQVDGSLLLSQPRWSALMEARWVGSRRDLDFSTFPGSPRRLPRYFVVNLGATVDLLVPAAGGRALELQLRVENLLGREFQEVWGYPAPGRALLLGGRMSVGG